MGAAGTQFISDLRDTSESLTDAYRATRGFSQDTEDLQSSEVNPMLFDRSTPQIAAGGGVMLIAAAAIAYVIFYS